MFVLQQNYFIRLSVIWDGGKCDSNDLFQSYKQNYCCYSATKLIPAFVVDYRRFWYQNRYSFIIVWLL